MRWFKLTVDTFESTTNPPNGSFVVMARKEGPQIHVRMFDGLFAFAGPTSTSHRTHRSTRPLSFLSYPFPNHTNHEQTTNKGPLRRGGVRAGARVRGAHLAQVGACVLYGMCLVCVSVVAASTPFCRSRTTSLTTSNLHPPHIRQLHHRARGPLPPDAHQHRPTQPHRRERGWVWGRRGKGREGGITTGEREWGRGHGGGGGGVDGPAADAGAAACLLVVVWGRWQRVRGWGPGVGG